MRFLILRNIIGKLSKGDIVKIFTLKNTETQDFFGYREEEEIGLQLNWIADNKEDAIKVVETLLKYIKTA